MSVPVTLYRHILRKIKKNNPAFSVDYGILTLSEKRVEKLYHDYSIDDHGCVGNYLIGIYPNRHKNLLAVVKSKIRNTSEKNIDELFEFYRDLDDLDYVLNSMIPKN
tara:strand:- start:750 stop:1070 length:321 start_codon:yes stop_codon:yes gene_type:complete